MIANIWEANRGLDSIGGCVGQCPDDFSRLTIQGEARAAFELVYRVGGVDCHDGYHPGLARIRGAWEPKPSFDVALTDWLFPDSAAWAELDSLPMPDETTMNTTVQRLIDATRAARGGGFCEPADMFNGSVRRSDFRIAASGDRSDLIWSGPNSCHDGSWTNVWEDFRRVEPNPGFGFPGTVRRIQVIPAFRASVWEHGCCADLNVYYGLVSGAADWSANIMASDYFSVPAGSKPGQRNLRFRNQYDFRLNPEIDDQHHPEMVGNPSGLGDEGNAIARLGPEDHVRQYASYTDPAGRHWALIIQLGQVGWVLVEE